MKGIFATVILAGLVLLAAHRVGAQTYVPGYYAPYWNTPEYQYYAQQYDPYYDLHVLHYQLYLPQYQVYPGYSYCCVSGGVLLPAPIAPRPPVVSPLRPGFGRR